MRKLFFCLGFGLSATAGYAQTPIKAGTIGLGGGINYSHNNNDSQFGGGSQSVTASRFQISPVVSYFVADDLSLGLNLNYAALSSAGSEARQLSAGLVLQKYRMLTDQFGLTGALGAGYTRSWVPGPVDITTNGFYASLTPGLIYFPVPKLGIGASVGGLSYGYDARSNSNSSSSSFGASFGLNQLTFSGTFFFGR